MELVAGIAIVIATVVVVALLQVVVTFLLRAQAELGDWLFHQEGNHWAKLFMFFVWVTLSLFKLLIIIINIIAVMFMAKKTVDWLKK